MVSMREIRAVGRRIAREFHPERVILFGSHARGTAREDSDVDLLVIMPFEGTGFRQSLAILNRLDLRLPIDLIAYRPDEADRRYTEGDPLGARGHRPRRGPLCPMRLSRSGSPRRSPDGCAKLLPLLGVGEHRARS